MDISGQPDCKSLILLEFFWSRKADLQQSAIYVLNNIMKNIICQECNKHYQLTPGSLGKFCSLSCSTANKNRKYSQAREAQYLANPSYCVTCNTAIPYKKRKNKFCSRSCAGLYNNAQKDWSNITTGPTPIDPPPYSSIRFIKCNHTGLWYSNRTPTGSIRRSSPYVKSKKQQYYWQARFRFNVYHYPEEFDLDLIDQHGWYSCPGKKRKRSPKNINGVSRDHIISVSYGFENNIDPLMIAHPANCRILLHSANKSKSGKSDMNVSELLRRIEHWNQKYSERRIGLEPMTSCLEGTYSTN